MITLHKIRRISNTLMDYFISIDEKDWPRLKELLADEFVYDNSLRLGGDPLHLTPKKFQELYEKPLEKVTMHNQTSTYRIHLKGLEATASCYFMSYQSWQDTSVTPPKPRLALKTGTMQFHLFEHGEEWKIDLIRIKFRIEEELQILPHGVPSHVDLKEVDKFRHPGDQHKVFGGLDS